MSKSDADRWTERLRDIAFGRRPDPDLRDPMRASESEAKKIARIEELVERQAQADARLRELKAKDMVMGGFTTPVSEIEHHLRAAVQRRGNCPRCRGAMLVRVERRYESDMLYLRAECRACEGMVQNEVSWAMLSGARSQDMPDIIDRIAAQGLESLAKYLSDKHNETPQAAPSKHTLEVDDAKAIVAAINALRAGSDLMVEFGMPSPSLDEAVRGLEDALRRHHYPVAPPEPPAEAAPDPSFPPPKPGRDLVLSLQDGIKATEKMG